MNFETKIAAIAKKAILKYPKVRQLAKVNHEDNFALFMFREGSDAAMDEVLRQIESRDMVNWFNEVSTKNRGQSYCQFDKIIYSAARQAYQELR